MTITDRIAKRRAELTKQRAERQDELDLPRTMTLRQVRAYLAETAALDQRIAAFEAAVTAYTSLTPLEPDQQWRDFLTTARRTIDAELLAMHPRIRNEKELEQQQRLTFSLRLIDFGLGISTIGPIISLASTRVGELMQAADFAVSGDDLRGPRGFRGSLPETEQRLKTLTRQRTAVQAALDAVLMTDEERAAREAEGQAYRDALNSMEIRGGDGLRAYHKDTGEPLDVSAMTEVQRRAFERADAAERQSRQDTINQQSGRG